MRRAEGRGAGTVIVCKSDAEIRRMGAATRVAAEVLQTLRGMVKPGVTTADLDQVAEATIRQAGGVPSFKGYRGFPATLCTSVNEQVIHGIPSAQVVLREGDILSIDVGVLLDGFHGDAAITVPVGRIDARTGELLRVTEEALHAGIARARVGGRVSDIGNAVQRHVEAHGFSVVKEFVGHGVGAALHEEPQVPNFGQPGRGPRLADGMVLAIEPMVAMGRAAVKVLGDGWTAVTQDGSLAAHFEHTVAVTTDGPLILTLPGAVGESEHRGARMGAARRV